MTEDRFDGDTFNQCLDGPRLTGQLYRVSSAVKDGRWRTLFEISSKTGDPEASVSARLRDLRKSRFGGFNVERRRIAGGLYEYRLLGNLNF